MDLPLKVPAIKVVSVCPYPSFIQMSVSFFQIRITSSFNGSPAETQWRNRDDLWRKKTVNLGCKELGWNEQNVQYQMIIYNINQPVVTNLGYIV